ncbi:hypothetical protein LSAT2_022831 [Lamellibrachia satsuma]|nr:hypothetical protein LSAT2_022831 [Lamellibrachia satsuma]
MDLYVPVSECSGKPFDKHTHICCDGHLYELADEHELTVLCCKDKIYNLATEICCGWERIMSKEYVKDHGTECTGRLPPPSADD